MKDRGRKIYVFAVICLIYWPHDVFSLKYPTVFWTPTNCRFNLNKKESGNAYEFLVKPMSAIFFACPNIALWRDITNDGFRMARMYENMWVVDKEGYESCTVNKTRNPKLVLRCDGDPRQLRYLKESFSPVRALEDQMQYESGKTYYFISTSTGTKKSLDNLSGGHCETRHMKLKITVCANKGPCPFNMLKCPYTDVFHKSTTDTSTQAQTTKNSTSSLNNGTSSLNNGTKVTTGISAVITPTATSREKPISTTLKEKVVQKPIHTRPMIVKPTQGKTAKRSSEETLWGPQRTHIIIHITMALIILILSLCLIYILITRRKEKSSAPGFSSKLYQERPTSAPIPLNGILNGDTSTSTSSSTAYHV